jgi:hypothetical protein
MKSAQLEEKISKEITNLGDIGSCYDLPSHCFFKYTSLLVIRQVSMQRQDSHILLMAIFAYRVYTLLYFTDPREKNEDPSARDSGGGDVVDESRNYLTNEVRKQ